MSEQNRSESYLAVMLKNPGKWFRVKKINGRPSDKRANRLERQRVVREIVTALKIMGIPYEQQKDNTRIRVLM